MFKKLISIAVVFCFSPLVFAGPITSNGGNAVLCKNSSGQYISAENFDLYEGHALYGYTPVIKSDSYQVQARAFASALSYSTDDKFFITEMDRLISEMKFLPSNIKLNPVNDADSIITPSGNCELLQAAVYLPDQKVYFDSNIWNLMNDTNRAALLSHEVLYAFLRLRERATTSVRTRQYVSFVFAGNILEPVWKPVFIPGTMEEYCSTDVDSYSYPANLPQVFLRTRLNNDNSWSISIERIGGRISLGKTEISGFPSMPYTWPVKDHQVGKDTEGGGVTLKPFNVTMPLEDGLRLEYIFLARWNSSHIIQYTLNGVRGSIGFKCQVVHYGSVVIVP